jgi:hypothetical protein
MQRAYFVSTVRNPNNAIFTLMLIVLPALVLSNFLESLSLASIKPRRIMLQTGAKNYG